MKRPACGLRLAARGGARWALLLVVSVGLAGPSAAARTTPQLAERIDTDLEAWDIEGAQRGLDDLLSQDPGSIPAAYFRARVLFEQGKYAESVTAFGEARSRGAGRIDGFEAQAKLAQAAADEVKGDEAHESAHFVMYTRPGKDALLVPYALEALEKAHAALTQDLGYSPPGKVRVEVYETAQALARVSPLTVAEIKASGTIALCKYSRLMITSPRALLRGYAWLDTLSHEFVHYLVTRKGRNGVPIWLQEGLAKFLETRWRGAPGLAVDEMSTALLTRAARDRKLIPFAAMHPSIAKLPTQEMAALAFAEVESAIKLLHQRGGQQALTELVAAMASGFSDENAVAQAYGKPFPQFEQEWRADVLKPRREPATQAPGSARPLASHKLVFKEDAKKKGAGAESAEERPSDPEAKRAVRLGEIFFARRRWAAAAFEYGKARARLSREVPLLARRYAFAQIQLGRLGEAESALAAAVSRDPQDEAAQVLYARVLAKRGEHAKARSALDAGIAVDPFDPELHDVYMAVAKELKDDALLEREKRALALALGERPAQKDTKEGSP
ncbi:MAG TPA: tetratricopeptide repeat protein [Myxococcales bacterium]|nr:MAG: tetratricopeptide repeat protein [Deltaproteobacteria bacterium]HMC34774.1 tetratricopeptide repeat protein [Myxococcales bacterium]